MGYYDQDFLNYYYYMASQFAVSDRWFSPVSARAFPIASRHLPAAPRRGWFTIPGSNDHLRQLNINNIFEELNNAGVSWKIYYTVTDGGCTGGTACGTGNRHFPDTTFESLSYSINFVY